jgi:hypothetical protein
VNKDGVGVPGAQADGELLARLCQMWEARDPVPPDLDERITFSLALEDLSAEGLSTELMSLREGLLVGTQARGEERIRTLTFSSESLSVLVSVDRGSSGALRLDGWIGEATPMEVELRTESGDRRERADGDGRFAFDGLPTGLVQLVFRPETGRASGEPTTVVTPTWRI